MAQVQVRISAECAAKLDAMMPRCLTVLRRRTRGAISERRKSCWKRQRVTKEL